MVVLSQLAKDLLASLPALDYVPEALQTIDRSDMELRQCKATVARIPKESPLSSITNHIEDLINEHQEDFYSPKGDAITLRCTTEQNEKDSSSFVLRTYVDRIDSLNCTTTYISEVYNICIATEKSAIVSGELTVHTYYGEDQRVNVQTQLVRTLVERTIQVSTECVHETIAQSEHITMSYEEQLARAIVKELVLFKESLDIRETFEAADLKKIRRILPITKTRFKWDPSAQRNVQLLNARQTDQES